MVIFMPYIKKRNSVFHTRHESVNTLECSVRTPAGVTAQAAEDISDTGAIKESRDVGSCENFFFSVLESASLKNTQGILFF